MSYSDVITCVFETGSSLSIVSKDGKYKLDIELRDTHEGDNYEVKHISIVHSERCNMSGEFEGHGSVHSLSPERIQDAVKAITTIVTNMNTVGGEKMFYCPDVKNDDLSVLHVKQTGRFDFSNHYAYLNMLLNPFWQEVFGKTASEMFCGGMPSAHGDKAYGYKDAWRKAGIPFRHGVLLFLLTYTKVMDEEKHKSEQWVIDHYQEYLPRILAAENNYRQSLT